MLRRREVIVCSQSAQHWDASEWPLCLEEKMHAHERYEVHLHRDFVELPDGTPITAVSFDADDPYGRATTPDYGLYLDARWTPPWAHEHVPWPDFGVPADGRALEIALQDLLRRARVGWVVDLGCLGGHGRTGTALACLAILTGQSPHGAVSWVRASYCPEAVETRDQEDFVSLFKGAD